MEPPNQNQTTSKKSYIWLKTSEGSILKVEEEVAKFSPMICREVLQNSMGLTEDYPIQLPQRVNTPILMLILDYFNFHRLPGRSNKEHKSFDEKFIRIDTERLFDLITAAHCLQLKPLVDLTSRAIARMIEGKTPEEIRETFNLPDDLTEEEKLEPLSNMDDYPQIRLLNRLYARKRKELKERDKRKNAEVEAERVEDERSVDDLLSFINGVGENSKAVKAPAHKKKNRKRNYETKEPCPNDGKDNKEADALPSALLNGKINISSSQTSEYQDLPDDLTEIDFDDGNVDDELEPAMKEKIDREVEEFSRRLKLDWRERMQEILSLGQEVSLAPISLNGNGSLSNTQAGSKVSSPK